MKLIFITIISLLLFSCNNDPAKTVDPSIIIGRNSSWEDLPYGDYYLYGEKYINGKHYHVYCADYKNKAIVYVYEEDFIIDYFFSNPVRRYKAEKVPLGTDYEEVVKKFGEPVFLIYPAILYDFRKDDPPDEFYCQYFRKTFNKRSLKYELTQNLIFFYFNSDKKLTKVESRWEWYP